MDIRRVVLYGALFVVIFSLWTSWQKEYPPLSPVTENAPSFPGIESPSVTIHPEVTPSSSSSANLSSAISIQSDVLTLNIDGAGNVVSAKLLQYPVNVEEKNNPFPLLEITPNSQYVAKSGLLVSSQNAVSDLNILYHAKQSEYVLKEGEDTLTVTLHGTTDTGLVVKKTYTLKRGSYLVDVGYRLENQSDLAWQGYFNNELSRTDPQQKSAMFAAGSYTGASYSNPGVTRYKKVSFKDMSKSNLSVDVTGGWTAMQQHYFLTAWIPQAEEANRIYTRVETPLYTIGSVSQPLMVAAHEEKTINAQLYLGPEEATTLSAIAPGLDLTIDYGWLWFISSLLFSLMSRIYQVIGNWGWSIVLVTVLVKLLFFRLSASSYKSMAGMRKLQPKLAALRERYGDDKAKMSQATMALYREEKVNPLGGCLPIVIQIPVFIALYWVLLESVELRQAPFILWINDLASPDPFHVLPLIMGVTMLVQQKLNPAPPDPMQAKVMMFLPVLFTILCWSFPSGLVLYWVVNNTLSIAQQWYITHKYGEKSSENSAVVVNK